MFVVVLGIWLCFGKMRAGGVGGMGSRRRGRKVIVAFDDVWWQKYLGVLAAYAFILEVQATWWGQGAGFNLLTTLRPHAYDLAPASQSEFRFLFVQTQLAIGPLHSTFKEL